MDTLAQLVIGHRGRLAFGLLLFTIAAVPGMTRVSFEEDPQVFFRRESRDLELLEQLAADFGPDSNDILIVVRADDLFTAKSIETLRALASRAAKVEGVDYSWSLARVKRSGSWVVPLLPYSNLSAERLERARQLALQHPLVAGHLLSPDATMTLVLVRMSGSTMELASAQRVVSQLRAICQEHSQDPNFDARLSGAATIAVESFAIAKSEVVRIGLISVVISAVIASVLFRHWMPTVIAVMGAMVGVAWTLGVMGYTGHDISGVTTILPTLLFVIGFSDAIHLILESRRGIAEGKSFKIAAQLSIRRVGFACLLTSLTSAVGFGSLVLAETEGVRQFGATCSFGVLLTFVSVITVVPLLMSTRLARHLRAVPPKSPDRLVARWAGAPLALVLGRPRLISVSGIMATLMLVVATFQLQPDIAMTEGIPLNSDTRAVVRDCDSAFGGSLHACVVVQWPPQYRLASPTVLGATDRVHRVLAQERFTGHPMSVLNILRSLPPAGENLGKRAPQLRRLPEHQRTRFLRLDHRKLLVTALVPDLGGAAMEPVFDRLEHRFQELEQEFPGFQISFTGAPVVSARNVRHMILDLTRSLLCASVIIFLIISVAFGSLRFGLISVIPNVLPLVLAAGMLVITGQSLRLAGAIAFTLCLGLAVDDTIHFLVRFRQQRRLGESSHRAVRQAYFQVGAAILTTSLVLTGGFAAMLVSVVPSILIFAEISCVAILAALIGDLVLLPALLLWPGDGILRSASTDAVPGDGR